VRIATWNVNSLKVRMPRVEAWLSDVQPDVVLLQETKLSDTAFPALALQTLGYEAAHHGQGQWNGVGILSRVGLDDVVAGFGDELPPDPEARVLWATCGGIRFCSVYVPNGRALDHDHYRYKLAWLGRLRAQVERCAQQSDALVIGGDFNIAPDDRDVYDPAAFVGATHVSEPERAELQALCDWGLTDLFRACHDGAGLYSWWDYRAGDFHQGRGLRIDLLLATAAVRERLEWSVVDRNARKGTQPSDHAPVIADLR
jgi:exodeoxyribonuclease-3